MIKAHEDILNRSLYKVWDNMIQRTSNINNKSYKDYGGRGIIVCERWKVFKNFHKDMNTGYSKSLSIDRINNAKGYSPENCRWANKSTQTRNTRVLRTDNKSGYRGVSWEKSRNRWLTTIRVNGKNKFIGRFVNITEAAKAYNTYVIENNLEHTINAL